jgi:methenyltetrahydrofolate cyclohydrolase
MDATTALQKVLDPQDNSTGGGSASALAGAMAAALAAMVARLSEGKSYGLTDETYVELSATGERLAAALAAGAGRDAEAFATVQAAYRLPRTGGEQRAARAAAIQAALTGAAEVPLTNATLCARALELARLLESRSNPNALSDLQCAGYLARAGLAGCLANVSINLPGIQDPAVVERLRAEADALRELLQDESRDEG